MSEPIVHGPLDRLVDAITLRRTMGRFATGVAVIGAMSADGRPHGMTVNSLTSVSLEPPMLLVCLAHGSRTTDAVIETQRFAVSILGARQEPIAKRFAARGGDHFAGLPLTLGEHQAPTVPNALAHLECLVDKHFDAGDHVVVLGRVHRTFDREGDPLAFFGGRFGDYVGRDHEPINWFF